MVVFYSVHLLNTQRLQSTVVTWWKVSKRGNKQVTVVRGMTCPIDDRKIILKEMKRKLGGGGSIIDGVLELQGAHGDKILELLRKKGYSKGKIVK